MQGQEEEGSGGGKEEVAWVDFLEPASFYKDYGHYIEVGETGSNLGAKGEVYWFRDELCVVGKDAPFPPFLPFLGIGPIGAYFIGRSRASI